MNTNNYTKLAESYVTSSNNHNLKLIALMFADDATYHSSFFGTFTGKKAINKMISDFFSRFPDAYWQVPDYHNLKDNIVEFEFVMTGTDAATGEQVTRKGIEKISFTTEGLISYLEVRKRED